MTISASMNIACADPEWRRKQSENKKALWADPVWVAKWKASRAKTKTGMVKHRMWNIKMRELGMSFAERCAVIKQWEGRGHHGK